MFKELRELINETNMLKIKIYGACAAFSLVFSLFNAALATYGHLHDMIYVIIFCVIFAILGTIGFIGFVIEFYEVLESSLTIKDR